MGRRSATQRVTSESDANDSWQGLRRWLTEVVTVGMGGSGDVRGSIARIVGERHFGELKSENDENLALR